MQSVSISFVLFLDGFPEGTESFTVSATGNQGFPSSETPLKTFSSTTIVFMDNDCKCLLNEYTCIGPYSYIYITIAKLLRKAFLRVGSLPF